MAEAGPYGITQFDAPGVIGAYQSMQANRINQMLAQKKLEQVQKAEKEQDATQKAIQSYYSGSGSATQTPTSTQSAPAAPPNGPTAADRQKLFASLMAINPQVATNVMETFSKMDQAQLQAAARTNLQLAQHATGYKMLPYEQRKAAIAKDAPMLQQLGLSPDQVNSFDPSDQNLNQIIAQSFDVERLAKFVQPDIHAVTQGGSLVATNPDGTQKTIYETPTIQGPNGEVYQRPSAMSSATSAAPQSAIDYLRQHPDLASQFDQKYGAGSSTKILGGQSVAPTGGFPQ